MSGAHNLRCEVRVIILEENGGIGSTEVESAAHSIGQSPIHGDVAIIPTVEQSLIPACLAW
jgi:hypothetical protein